MDITFVKMCDCEEIQGREWEYGDCFIQIYANGQSSELQFMSRKLDDPYYGDYPIFRDNLRAIWLPTQDQLQKMIGLNWRSFDKRCLVYEHPTRVPTKEQAGIRVVMEEKHNKTWDGEKWVKE